MSVGFTVRPAVVKAVDIGKQQYPIRSTSLGHPCGQPVIVTKADFVGGDAVIFVDHRNGAMFEQLFQCRGRVEIAFAIFHIVEREQHLCGGKLMLSEQL